MRDGGLLSCSGSPALRGGEQVEEAFRTVVKEADDRMRYTNVSAGERRSIS